MIELSLCDGGGDSFAATETAFAGAPSLDFHEHLASEMHLVADSFPDVEHIVEVYVWVCHT